MNSMKMHFSLVTIFWAVLLCQVSCQTIRYLKFAANARISDIYADGKPLGDNIIINKPWSKPTILPLPWNSSLLALRLESSLIPKAWIMADSTTKCVYVTRPAIAKCVPSSDVASASKSWFRTDFNDFRWSTAMVSRSAQSVLVYPTTSQQFCTYAQWLWTPTAANVIYCRLNITQTDECKTGNGGCSVNAQCTNIPGNRTCSCNAGYTGDGVTCNDIDECKNSDRGGCNSKAQCRNTQGSRICSCDDGYFGDGLNCTGCQSNCDICSGPTTCSQCSSGYYKDGGGVCQGCPQFCQTCTGPTVCTTCINADHKLSIQANNDAFCCQSNCDICSGPTTCSQCSSGHYKDGDGVCQGCQSNCDVCSGPTTCSQCSSGHYKDGGGVCQGCSEFCTTCTGPTVCTTCIDDSHPLYTTKMGHVVCCWNSFAPQMDGECSNGAYGWTGNKPLESCKQECLGDSTCHAVIYYPEGSACYINRNFCYAISPSGGAYNYQRCD